MGQMTLGIMWGVRVPEGAAVTRYDNDPPADADGYCARCRAVVAEVRAEGAAARAVPGTQLPLRGAP